MAIFITAFLVCLALYKSEWFQAGNTALAGFALLFLTVAHYHTRLEDRLHRLQLWQGIKRANLGRHRLDWEKIPHSDVPAPPSHPYATDLDLTGAHSLLRVVDSTIT